MQSSRSSPGVSLAKPAPSSSSGTASTLRSPVTRFSGKCAHLPEGTDPVTRDAYSHEVISFGFWPGDRNVRDPTFYSDTAPEPEGLTEQSLHPQAASWAPEGGTALLAYEEVRNNRNPREILLEFLQSAYEAGAKTAGYDLEDFRTSAG